MPIATYRPPSVVWQRSIGRSHPGRPRSRPGLPSALSRPGGHGPHPPGNPRDEGADRLPVGYVATHHTATKKGGLIWMQEQVRREAHRIEFGWVRAHVGDSLNEGADIPD